jgi:hypothetical protein
VAGAAVAAAVVDMLAGVPAKLVAVKLNGPPDKSDVIFWIATKGMAGLTIFVNVQTSFALVRTFTAGMVSTLPASVPNVPAGFPDATALLSMQFAPVMVKFVASVSVMVTAVPVALAAIGDGTAG